MVKHAVFEAKITRFPAHLLHAFAPLGKFGLPEAEMKAARALMTHRNACIFCELGSERWPFVGRAPGPALIVGRARTFALHPDETEIPT